MPHVVRNRAGAWELRESVRTSDGPRSRTLATFRVLTPEHVAQALARASSPLTGPAVRAAARRVGAPVALPPADASATALIAELDAGRRPRPGLRRALRALLGEDDGRPTDAELAAARWAAATAEQRAAALWDLLLLTDRLPPPRTERPRFPSIESSPA